ncbi:MAG TPA: ATP-binding cassette domain-containing protein, partial [Blastocatellia bacterium]|nr:ATP-binding cassette domain-containing protein [Blastocatellia bacterium]
MNNTDNNSPVIEFRNVSLSVAGGKRLVEDLSFTIARGETVVLLGRSGSGKTTTLKLINRLLDPTAGEILVEGKPTREWDAIRLRRRIGYVIQESGLFPHFTVEQNVELVPR